MSKTPKAGKPLPPEPFDERDPPPRRRPRGTPLGADVTLPPGEDIAGIFTQWDAEGRVPPGSILCAARHLTALRDRGSPLAVVARTADAPAEPDLDLYRVTTWICREPSPARRWCVLSPITHGKK